MQKQVCPARQYMHCNTLTCWALLTVFSCRCTHSPPSPLRHALQWQCGTSGSQCQNPPQTSQLIYCSEEEEQRGMPLMKFFSSRPGELCTECNLRFIYNSLLPLVRRYVHKPFVPETCVLRSRIQKLKERSRTCATARGHPAISIQLDVLCACVLYVQLIEL